MGNSDTFEDIMENFRKVLSEKNPVEVNHAYLDIPAFMRPQLARALGVIGEGGKEDMTFRSLEPAKQTDMFIAWWKEQLKHCPCDADDFSWGGHRPDCPTRRRNPQPNETRQGMFTRDEKAWIEKEFKKQADLFLEHLRLDHTGSMINALTKLDGILTAVKMLHDGHKKLHLMTRSAEAREFLDFEGEAANSRGEPK